MFTVLNLGKFMKGDNYMVLTCTAFEKHLQQSMGIGALESKAADATHACANAELSVPP